MKYKFMSVMLGVMITFQPLGIDAGQQDENARSTQQEEVIADAATEVITEEAIEETVINGTEEKAEQEETNEEQQTLPKEDENYEKQSETEVLEGSSSETVSDSAESDVINGEAEEVQAEQEVSPGEAQEEEEEQETSMEEVSEEIPEKTQEEMPEIVPEEEQEAGPEEEQEEEKRSPEAVLEEEQETSQVETQEEMPETSQGVMPEVIPEHSPEATPEVTTEATPEATTEATPETMPEAAPEAAPEATPEESHEEISEVTLEPAYGTEAITLPEMSPEVVAEPVQDTREETLPETFPEKIMELGKPVITLENIQQMSSNHQTVAPEILVAGDNVQSGQIQVVLESKSKGILDVPVLTEKKADGSIRYKIPELEEDDQYVLRIKDASDSGEELKNVVFSVNRKGTTFRYDATKQYANVEKAFTPVIKLEDVDATQVLACMVNGKESKYVMKGNQIEISSASLIAGKNQITVAVRDAAGHISVMDPWEFRIQKDTVKKEAATIKGQSVVKQGFQSIRNENQVVGTEKANRNKGLRHLLKRVMAWLLY